MPGPGLLQKLLNGDSTVSTNGETPIINTIAGENGVESLLDSSTLDSDNAPEGQSGRI